jgi:hypothetical protein
MTRPSAPRSNASRLFDPPSLDDLDCLPDPLGRFGPVDYPLRPDADPQGWEEMRAGWPRRIRPDDWGQDD